MKIVRTNKIKRKCNKGIRLCSVFSINGKIIAKIGKCYFFPVIIPVVTCNIQSVF